MPFLADLLWKIFAIGETAYLIVAHHWSAWWMLLAILLAF